MTQYVRYTPQVNYEPHYNTIYTNCSDGSFFCDNRLITFCPNDDNINRLYQFAPEMEMLLSLADKINTVEEYTALRSAYNSLPDSTYNDDSYRIERLWVLCEFAYNYIRFNKAGDVNSTFRKRPIISDTENREFELKIITQPGGRTSCLEAIHAVLYEHRENKYTGEAICVVDRFTPNYAHYHIIKAIRQHFGNVTLIVDNKFSDKYMYFNTRRIDESYTYMCT